MPKPIPHIQQNGRIRYHCPLCHRERKPCYRFYDPHTKQMVWGCRTCEATAAMNRGYEPVDDWEYRQLLDTAARRRFWSNKPEPPNPPYTKIASAPATFTDFLESMELRSGRQRKVA